MKIGRTVRVLTDYNRNDPFNATDKRQVVISIFYPARDDIEYSGLPVYSNLFHPAEEKAVKLLVDKKGENREIIENLNINTYNEAPFDTEVKKCPVAIYVPGFGSSRDMAIYNIENLVLEGYIVITIGFSYESIFNIFPDGKIISQSDSMPSIFSNNIDKLLCTRKEDMLFLLDSLYEINNKDTLLKGKLDLDRIGSFGHSLGGATIIEVMSIDKRIKCGIDLDGPVLNTKGVTGSFLMFHGDSITLKDMLIDDFSKIVSRSDLASLVAEFNDETEKNREFYNNIKGCKSAIRLKGAKHRTFTDSAVLAPDNDAVRASISADRAHEIIKSITAAFFNEFLCDQYGAYRTLIEKRMYDEIEEIGDGSSDLV